MLQCLFVKSFFFFLIDIICGYVVVNWTVSHIFSVEVIKFKRQCTKTSLLEICLCIDCLIVYNKEEF